LDNSLISAPIDLTRARFATLAFDTAYNVNTKAGNPPDAVRVEISQDAGVSWQPVNLGVRMDAGVSGGGGSPVWVSSATLARLESNISGWAGSVVNLRFRVVTTTEPGYVHCATAGACVPPVAPGLGGVWVDNIRISGTSSGGLSPGNGIDELRIGEALSVPLEGISESSSNLVQRGDRSEKVGAMGAGRGLRAPDKDGIWPWLGQSLAGGVILLAAVTGFRCRSAVGGPNRRR
jgi:hypothetical protein